MGTPFFYGDTVMSRVFRRCDLLGNDPDTGKNQNHRNVLLQNSLFLEFPLSLMRSCRTWVHPGAPNLKSIL
jgi:hypothetical protein